LVSSLLFAEQRATSFPSPPPRFVNVLSRYSYYAMHEDVQILFLPSSSRKRTRIIFFSSLLRRDRRHLPPRKGNPDDPFSLFRRTARGHSFSSLFPFSSRRKKIVIDPFSLPSPWQLSPLVVSFFSSLVGKPAFFLPKRSGCNFPPPGFNSASLVFFPCHIANFLVPRPSSFFLVGEEIRICLSPLSWRPPRFDFIPFRPIKISCRPPLFFFFEKVVAFSPYPFFYLWIAPPPPLFPFLVWVMFHFLLSSSD